MDAGDTASLAGLVAAFESGADPQRAEQMRAYMRGRFEFLGIASPQRRRLAAPFLASMKGAGERRLLGVAGQLWAMPRREYAYVAADLLRKYERALGPTALGPLRDLVTTDSWWDGVDPLSHIVGSIVRAHPEVADQMDRWVEDPDLWVVRVAIIHQLGWKADAEPSRIFGYCEARSDHPDFFVRKAIGWALRDLARTFPTEVRDFVEAHRSELSPLSVREATKHLRDESPGAGGPLGGRLTP